MFLGPVGLFCLLIIVLMCQEFFCEKKNIYDVHSTFQTFFYTIKNQFRVELKRIRSNNAREYFSQTLSPFF